MSLGSSTQLILGMTDSYASVLATSLDTTSCPDTRSICSLMEMGFIAPGVVLFRVTNTRGRRTVSQLCSSCRRPFSWQLYEKPERDSQRYNLSLKPAKHPLLLLLSVL